jgi:Pyruvate phosphate dikinase, AMP/ATP-binding domain
MPSWRSCSSSLRSFLRRLIRSAGRAIPLVWAKTFLRKHVSVQNLQAVTELGANVAVRSSASCEDTVFYAAAGRAQYYLNVKSEDRLWSAILSVWASLYTVRFVEYRKSHGLSDGDSRMAIVLQKMVAARASGVASSVNIDGRPGFNINAGFGLGAGVGNYGDPTDWWFVGPDAKHILESQANRLGPPALSEVEVLKLSSLIKDVRGSATREGNGHHINVEFAVDHTGRCFVLQCRPDTSERSSDGIKSQSRPLMNNEWQPRFRGPSSRTPWSRKKARPQDYCNCWATRNTTNSGPAQFC